MEIFRIIPTAINVETSLDPPLERPFSFVHQKQKFRVRVMDELLEFARNYCENNQAT